MLGSPVTEGSAICCDDSFTAGRSRSSEPEVQSSETRSSREDGLPDGPPFPAAQQETTLRCFLFARFPFRCPILRRISTKASIRFKYSNNKLFF